MSIKELFGHAIGVVKFGDIAKFYNYLTKRNHTLKGDITFEGDVDMTNASLVGLPPAYATEIEAIDAGLAFGDKYVDSDGVVQTVTKIKQVLTLPTSKNSFGFLIDLDTLASKTILNVLPGYQGTIQGRSLTGTNVNFVSTQPSYLNTLSEFTNGYAYDFTPTTAYSRTFYEAPLNTSYKRSLINGTVNVVHASETTDTATATAWIDNTLISIDTYTNGVLVNEPTTWEKGKGYAVRCADTQAAIGAPSTPVPVDRSNGEVGQVLVPDTNGDAVWGTPSWTTAARPTPLTGQYPMGFNITTSTHEGWDGSTWNDLY